MQASLSEHADQFDLAISGAVLLNFCMASGRTVSKEGGVHLIVSSACRSYLILRIAWRQLFGDGQAEDVREED